MQGNSKPPVCAKCGRNHSGTSLRDPLVVSSVFRMVISCASVQRTSREMVMGEIEPSFLPLLHLEGLLSVPAREQTNYIPTIVVKSKRIRLTV